MEGETAGNGGHNDRHLTVNTHRRFIALHSPPFVKGLSSGGMTGRRNGRETASQDNGCTKKNRGARDQSKHEASSIWFDVTRLQSRERTYFCKHAGPTASPHPCTALVYVNCARRMEAH